MTQPLISAKNISFKGDGRWILQAISFDIQAGEIVTLIGPNGGGKTTFARICLGILEPDKGTVVQKPGLSIGYVPQLLQRDRTLPLTVRRFLTLRQAGFFPSTAQRPRLNKDADLNETLDWVGVRHLIDAQLVDLSGGELQRVLLARALLITPDILVLDEPVQGVDFAGEAALYQLISDIRTEIGCAVMLISHDLNIVMGHSDRVLCLNGHVCCEGVPAKISEHPEYARLFGPERAAQYGLYQHKHDHSHGLCGHVHEGDCGDNDGSHDDAYSPKPADQTSEKTAHKTETIDTTETSEGDPR